MGKSVRTLGVTVTESHLVQFSGVAGIYHPLQTDAEWSRQSRFGRRIAQGALTFALAVGCMYQSRFYGDAIVAWLGANQILATAPVKIGDTLHVEATVTNCRPAKDSSRGIVDLDYSVRNQKEEEVMILSLTMLMRSRESAS